MLSWWHRDVIAAGKLPLMLCFLSFVVTFASTRTITRYRSGLFGLFLPPVGAIGAVRLARPNSIWARHRYRGKRLERAARRAAAFDRRWTPLQAGWLDFIGGRPSLPNPTSSQAPQAPQAPEAASAPGGGAAPRTSSRPPQAASAPGGGAAPDEPAAGRAAGS